MKFLSYRLGMLLFLALVTACSDSQSWRAPEQPWQDLGIHVETRPSPAQVGMNEFLVMANRQQKGFTSDLIVHIRTDVSDWKQAIPDGALGVYRRALPVENVQENRLYVRLERKGEMGELTFALAPDSMQ
ncbi:MAG: hypothetical protein HQM07_05835 [Zetaproteobacteria bacterium]|nr:hypothetical protein [Zetaproteobacteria bacterium]